MEKAPGGTRAFFVKVTSQVRQKGGSRTMGDFLTQPGGRLWLE